jgi:hypothetical protein
MGAGDVLKQNLQSRDNVSPCCKQKGTLKRIQEQTSANCALYVCTVCGRKHRYMLAEPGLMGLKR